jgi:hypothetical protein
VAYFLILRGTTCKKLSAFLPHLTAVVLFRFVHWCDQIYLVIVMMLALLNCLLCLCLKKDSLLWSASLGVFTYLFSCLTIDQSTQLHSQRNTNSLVAYLFFDCRLKQNNELAMQTNKCIIYDLPFILTKCKPEIQL